MNRELIQRELLFEEGLRQQAYKDTLGHWTIGVGRAFEKNRLTQAEVSHILKDAIISRDSAIYLLDNDITKVWSRLVQLLPWIEKLDEVRQRALVNMAFQLGVGGLMNFRSSLSYIEKGDWVGAGKALRNSLWYSQTRQRAERVIRAIEKGDNI